MKGNFLDLRGGSMQGLDGALYVHKVESQGRVELVDDREIVWVEPSGYRLREALQTAQS